MDNTDISTFEGRDVRPLVNVVSQEPFFIPGSIRMNLDPLGNSSDECIEAALSKVDLQEKVVAYGGLNATLVASEWSHGEKQLLCLAKAVLAQSKKILVMDEATSRYVSLMYDLGLRFLCT